MIKKLFTAAFAAFVTLALHAATYTPVFTQDFEDEATFKQNFAYTNSANRIFGVETEGTWKPDKGDTYSTATQGERTLYDTETTSKFYRFWLRKYQASGGMFYSLTLDTREQMYDGYKVTFYAHLFAPVSSYDGIAIQGESAALATMWVAGAKANTSTVTIYKGDDSANTLGTFLTTERDVLPEAESETDRDNAPKYWAYFEVEGVKDDGVYLTITRGDGETNLARTKISDSFEVISGLYYYEQTCSYGRVFSLDDVVVYKSSPEKFVWIGNTDDVWTSEYNWAMYDTPGTAVETYPTSADVAFIGDVDGWFEYEGEPIVIDQGSTLGELQFDSDVKLQVTNFNITATGEPVTLFTYVSSTIDFNEDNVLFETPTGWVLDEVTYGEGEVSATFVDATQFTWTGASESEVKLWSDPTNWAYTDKPGMVAQTAPTRGSAIVFPETFTDGVIVDFDADVSVAKDAPTSSRHLNTGSITLNCAATFHSADATVRTFYPPLNISGERLTLENITFRTDTYLKTSFDCDVVIKDTVTFCTRGDSARYYFNQAVIADESATMIVTGDNPSQSEFSGDMSGFCGTLDLRYFNVFFADALNLSNAKVLTTAASQDDKNKNLWNRWAIQVDGSVPADSVLKLGSLSGTGWLKNNVAGNITLEVGAANADAEWSGTLELGAEDSAWSISKVGSGAWTLPLGYKFPGALSVSEGKLKFSIDYDDGDYQGWFSDGEAHELVSGTFAAESISADNVEVELLNTMQTYNYTIDNSEAKVLKVVISVSEDSYTYVGENYGYWSDLANWKLGDEAATQLPGKADKVEIADKIVLITQNQEFESGTLTLGDDARLAILVTDPETFRAIENVDLTKIILAGPYEFTDEYKDEVQRVASQFVWTGAVDTEWNTAGNWKVESMPTAVVPNANDDVVFPDNNSGWALTVNNNDANVSNVWLSVPLTLNSGNKALRPVCVAGPGSLTLNGGNISHQNADIIISNNVNVAEEATSLITVLKKQTCHIYGNLTGSGTLKWSIPGDAPGSWNGLGLHGDNTAFAGTFEQSGGYGGRSGTSADENSWSSNAVWKCNFRAKDNTTVLVPNYSAFGALIGSIQCGNGNQNIEIGNRDDIDSVFTIVNRTTGSGASQGFNITKVGSAKLTLPTMSNMNNTGHPNSGLRSLDIQGGTVEIPQLAAIASDRPSFIKFNGEGAKLMATPYVEVVEEIEVTKVADPSDVIKNSTTAITYDSNGTDAIWSTALAASNLPEIVKQGAGTLTLTEVPAWEGATTVTVAPDAGAVYLPVAASYTLGENTFVTSETIDEVEYNKFYYSSEPATKPGLIFFIR